MGTLCHGIISRKENYKGSVREYVLHAITFASAQQIPMRQYLLVQSKENLFLKETTYLKGVIIGCRKKPYLLLKQHRKEFLR